MGADVSRARFDPLRHFSSVVLQQGRLLLDADFNEYVALLDRRLRAETSDLTSFGPDPDQAGVAWVPRQTPNAFRVTASGGELAIGRGRMYVDGLVAENHGGAPFGFDPLLSERTRTADTPYDEQPYWPTPDPLPSGGPHLAYLDVWQREVTHLEDPELVDVAVGVDTSARLQTVWQVRVLPGIGSATCASDDDEIPGWLDVIRPSAGRLTTGTVEVAADDDPCELPPTGGYRGLENQTYRVEIHDGGAPGTATFKWSRDNGSVAVPVVEMVSPTVLRLATVGKDDVLRVSTGDWVEILDDRYELDGRPGVMRKVTVDDAARTMTFTGTLPADLRPANADEAAARHLRVRRWDQSGTVRSGAGATLVDLDQPGSTGLITVPSGAGTEVVLEHGIVVSFSVATTGGVFRPGDYWMFVARTANTSVETLDDAPPRGVHHHFARLGVVTFPGSQTDCRRLWPPLDTGDGGCECTVCVTPSSHASGALTVQQAVDQVKETGGTICLAPGVYDVAAGVTIDGARSLRLHGHGPATVLVARGTALTVTRSAAVTLESMAVVSGAGAPAAVRLRSVVATTLQDLVVLSYPSREGGGSAVELSGVGLLVSLRRNVLVGRTAVVAGGGERIGLFAAALRVEDNVVVGFDRGVDLGGLSAYLYACRVSGNDVLGGRAGGIVATGAVMPGGSLDVKGNKVATGGAGITVGADAVVDANTVNRLGNASGTDGVVVAPGPFTATPGHVRITGNRVHERSGTGIALRTAVRTLMVKENVLATVGAGIAVEGQGAAERAALANNEVFDVVPPEGEARLDAALGIFVARAGSAAVIDNTVTRVGQALVEGRVRAGIVVLGCEDVRASGNVVDEVGPRGEFLGVAAGIAVVGPFERLAASENSVRYSAEAPAPGQGGWFALLVQSGGRGVARVGAGKAVVPLRAGALVMTGAWGYATAGRGDHANVESNSLAGGGDRPTCLVRVAGDVVAQANQCAHEGREEQSGILLEATAVTAASNRVRGGKAMLVLRVPEDRFAALGNLAAGGTHLGGPGAGLPSPWDALNPIVS
ncbi:MAG TPA: DUF6519 domain-containing protein [Gaiellaceae bacterium]|nr:DUF6519 domain-containing protein [Gaiellaceae bacterium]